MASHINKSLMLPLRLNSLISPLLLQLLSPLEMRDISQSTRHRHNRPIVAELRIRTRQDRRTHCMAMSVAPEPVQLKLKFVGFFRPQDSIPVFGHDRKVCGVEEDVPVDFFKGHDGVAADFEPLGVAISHLYSVRIHAILRLKPCQCACSLTLRSTPKL